MYSFLSWIRLRKSLLIGIILTGFGISRCLYDLIFYPRLATWGAWIIPRPQVFVDKHYFLQKRLVLETDSGQILTFNLNSQAQWPIKNNLLIFSYTFVHCLDRPQLINDAVCSKMLRFHFCMKGSQDQVLKQEFLSTSIKSIRNYIGSSDSDLKLVREVICLP